MPDYRTAAASYNGVTVTVRERIGRDVCTEQIVSEKLSESEPAYLRSKFGEFVTRTLAIEGDLGYAWPTLNSNVEETRMAYLDWGEMKPQLMIAWGNALYEVNQPMGDVDLAPKTPGE